MGSEKGIYSGVISGAKSEGVVRRLNGLGISYVLAGVDDKVAALHQLSQSLRLDLSTAIFIGDDIPDLQVMQLCGIPCCPSDAAPEVQAVSKYISPIAGGKGCVREILEKVMKLQGKWE
jgi:3-deoxy-D-manno-octulosonate 8-phosphate phosphatase (KDO 8-P phosphatase)